MKKSNLRIGCVNFLNAVPLVRNLPFNNLYFDIPSNLSDKLKSNNLDIALISTIEYARNHKNYKIIDDLCIASAGRVKSILLFSKLKLKNISKVYCDYSSRSSVVMLQILLKEIYNIKPQIILFDYKKGIPEYPFLLIGDNALKHRILSEINYYDLGEMWERHFKLPFVYAFWTGKKNLKIETEDFILAYKNNIKQYKNLIEKDDDFEFNLNYITNIIKYDFREYEKRGIMFFFRKAKELSFIDDIPDLNYY